MSFDHFSRIVQGQALMQFILGKICGVVVHELTSLHDSVSNACATLHGRKSLLCTLLFHQRPLSATSPEIQASQLLSHACESQGARLSVDHLPAGMIQWKSKRASRIVIRDAASFFSQRTIARVCLASTYERHPSLGSFTLLSLSLGTRTRNTVKSRMSKGSAKTIFRADESHVHSC